MKLRILYCGAVALAACGQPADEAAVLRSEGLEIRTALAPASARVGKNELEITLRDAEGRAVEGADLDVKVHMHAMGAMPAMGGAAQISELGGGRYRADFELDMGGTWLVEMQAKPASGPMARAEGSLTVGTPGVQLAAIGAAPESAAAAASGDAPGELRLSPERLQKIGVRMVRAERRPMAAARRPPS